MATKNKQFTGVENPKYKEKYMNSVTIVSEVSSFVDNPVYKVVISN